MTVICLVLVLMLHLSERIVFLVFAFCISFFFSEMMVTADCFFGGVVARWCRKATLGFWISGYCIGGFFVEEH